MNDFKEILKKHCEDFLKECLTTNSIEFCEPYNYSIKISDDYIIFLVLDSSYIIVRNDKGNYNDIFNKYFERNVIDSMINDFEKTQQSVLLHQGYRRILSIIKLGEFPLCIKNIKKNIYDAEIDISNQTFNESDFNHNAETGYNSIRFFSEKDIKYRYNIGKNYYNYTTDDFFNKFAIQKDKDYLSFFTTKFLFSKSLKEVKEFFTKNKSKIGTISIQGEKDDILFFTQLLLNKIDPMDFEFEAMCKAKDSKITQYINGKYNG